MEFTLKRPKLVVVLEYQKKAQEAEGKADGQLKAFTLVRGTMRMPKDIALSWMPISSGHGPNDLKKIIDRWIHVCEARQVLMAIVRRNCKLGFEIMEMYWEAITSLKPRTFRINKSCWLSSHEKRKSEKDTGTFIMALSTGRTITTRPLTTQTAATDSKGCWVANEIVTELKLVLTLKKTRLRLQSPRRAGGQTKALFLWDGWEYPKMLVVQGSIGHGGAFGRFSVKGKLPSMAMESRIQFKIQNTTLQNQCTHYYWTASNDLVYLRFSKSVALLSSIWSIQRRGVDCTPSGLNGPW